MSPPGGEDRKVHLKECTRDHNQLVVKVQESFLPQTDWKQGHCPVTFLAKWGGGSPPIIRKM